MHRLIETRFEDYLEGTLGESERGDFENHLAACEECKAEVGRMQMHSDLLRALRVPEPPEVAPGFYARVVDRIDSQRTTSVWYGFLQPSLIHQIAFASLLVLVLFGGYIFTAPADRPAVAGAPTTAEAIMASDHVCEKMGHDRNRDRTSVLVTLATYDSN